MKLFLTDTTFKIHGHSYPGVPFMVDDEMVLAEAPNDYLFHVAVVKGRTASPRTWETYANHLYEFFGFLEANGLAWAQANETHIAAWRDAMLERGCQRSTVNQRLRCVGAFYDWALKGGRIGAMPFGTEDVWVAKPKGFLAHVDASGGRTRANELTLRTHKATPQFLHLNQASAFLEAMTPYRLKLMGYMMLLTGMRREEVVGFDYRVLPNPAGRDPGKLIPMVLDPALTPTKGAKKRTVMLPYDLAVALDHYFTFEWPKLNIRYKRTHGHETTRLFLSQGAEPLSIPGTNNAFCRVSAKSGIKCHPHMLRHTYGTYELLRMTREKTESQALLWVKDRMGHSSTTTTEQYIHAADLIMHDDIDGYQADILEALRRAG